MNEIKSRDLKKIKNIPYKQLTVQDYLESEKIFTHRKKILFKVRTNMINVNYNYGKKVACPICLVEEDTQNHLIECNEIINSDPPIKTSHIKLEDAFGKDIAKANELSIVIEKVLQRRETILDSRTKNIETFSI